MPAAVSLPARPAMPEWMRSSQICGELPRRFCRIGFQVLRMSEVFQGSVVHTRAQNGFLRLPPARSPANSVCVSGIKSLVQRRHRLQSVGLIGYVDCINLERLAMTAGFPLGSESQLSERGSRQADSHQAKFEW